jgi:hypothetical protein
MDVQQFTREMSLRWLGMPQYPNNLVQLRKPNVRVSTMEERDLQRSTYSRSENFEIYIQCV